jgi:fused signal recognition particle receptor
MFDSLKKRLKETIDRVAKSIKEEKEPKEIIEETPTKEPKRIEGIIEEQPLPEVIEEKEQEQEEKPTEIKEENLEEIIEEEKEVTPEEVVEEIREEEKEEEIRPESVIEAAEEAEFIEKHEEEKETTKEKKPGLFRRFFEKTITESDMNDILKELKIVLMENDVAIDVVERIEEDIKKELTDRSVRRGKIADAIRAALRSAMLDVLSQDKINLDERIGKKEGVFTILFLGFNGTGKTTTVAKFAKKFAKYSPIVAAADTFRAASIEQLEEHSKRLGFRLVKHKYGDDSAAVIYDARKAAVAAGSKLVIADTAGRSHSNINLMDELKKICRVISPDMKILVLDAMTGNDIFEQSRLFNDAVGVDAIILTKADVYAKGGAALSATHTIKKPILYLGTGQEYGDLKEFDPEEIVDNLLG